MFSRVKRIFCFCGLCLLALKNTTFAASIYHQFTTSAKTHFSQCFQGWNAFLRFWRETPVYHQKNAGGMPPNGWRRIARPRASRQHLHGLRLLLVVYAWPLVVDAQPQPSASVGPCASLPSPAAARPLLPSPAVGVCRPSSPCHDLPAGQPQQVTISARCGHLSRHGQRRTGCPLGQCRPNVGRLAAAVGPLPVPACVRLPLPCFNRPGHALAGGAMSVLYSRCF